MSRQTGYADGSMERDNKDPYISDTSDRNRAVEKIISRKLPVGLPLSKYMYRYLSKRTCPQSGGRDPIDKVFCRWDKTGVHGGCLTKGEAGRDGKAKKKRLQLWLWLLHPPALSTSCGRNFSQLGRCVSAVQGVCDQNDGEQPQSAGVFRALQLPQPTWAVHESTVSNVYIPASPSPLLAPVTSILSSYI